MAPPQAWQLLCVVVPVLLMTAPLLWLRYLPMTDYPQHLALASILAHVDDPAFGFAQYYEPAWDRSLYVAHFGLALALAELTSLENAMRIVVMLSVALYPIGLAYLLMRSGRPPWLALVAIPAVYNRSVFWGLIASNLSFGLALFGCAWLHGRPTRAYQVALFVLGGLISATHLFGVLILLGYALLRWLVSNPRPSLASHWPLLSSVAGLTAWTVLAVRATPVGGFTYPSLTERIVWLEPNLLGGYQGGIEPWLLTGIAALLLVLLRRPFDRIGLAYVSLCALLYLTLPLNTPGLMIVNQRLGVLGLCLTPLVLGPAAVRSRPRLKLAGLMALALLTASYHVRQLHRFDAEARTLDDVIARLPDRPSLLALSYDASGSVARGWPYLHAGGYVQARKGGVLATSFAGFGTLPVRSTNSYKRPQLPPLIEWNPALHDEAAFGHDFDFVLVRSSSSSSSGATHVAPTRRLRFAAPPWLVFERAEVRGPR